VAPRKEGMKQDPFAEDSNQNSDTLSDTTTRLKDVIKSWMWVYEILEKENSLFMLQLGKLRLKRIKKI